MKKIKEAIEAAWQKTHFDETNYDPNYPIKASKNFADGFEAGTAWALSSQWRSVDDELPEYYKDVFVFLDNIPKPTIGRWGEFGKPGSHCWCVVSSLGNNKYSDWDDITVKYWMPIPSLPK